MVWVWHVCSNLIILCVFVFVTHNNIKLIRKLHEHRDWGQKFGVDFEQILVENKYFSLILAWFSQISSKLKNFMTPLAKKGISLTLIVCPCSCMIKLNINFTWTFFVLLCCCWTPLPNTWSKPCFFTTHIWRIAFLFPLLFPFMTNQ